MDRIRARRIASPLLALAASALLLVGDLSLYGDRALFAARPFANRAASALRDEEVRGLVGRQVADEVIEAEPDLIGAKPLIEAAVQGIAAAPPFQVLLAAGLRDLHRTAFSRDDDTATLKLADVGVLVADALRVLNPRLAARVPEDLDARITSVSEGRAFTDLAQLADGVGLLAAVSLALAVALFALSAWIARDRRLAVRRLGLAAAAVGALVVVGFEVARALVASRFTDPADRGAARAIFDALLLDLRTWNLVLAAAGLITAAVAASLIRPLDATATLRRAWAVVSTPPVRPWPRGARALALVALGAVIVLEHDAVLRLAVVALGLFVLYLGVAELLRLTSAAAAPAGEVRARRPRRPSRRALALPAVVALLAIGAAAGAAALANDPEEPPTELRACNGHRELCDRPLDRISFPSTHNSMSAASEPGWLFAGQERGIREQLAGGIRGLLIDTHYGIRTRRGVYTVLQQGSKSRAKIQDELGPKFVATAERLRARMGYRGGGRREVYLCHGYCEVGATRAETALRAIRDFLLQHPFEVIVISVEDDTEPRDTAAAFRSSGLLELVWKAPLRDGRLPTPRQMVESGERVLVMAENETGGIRWLRPQFELVQETPFDVKTVAALADRASCRPNRGRAANPVLMLNNWVETTPAPLPSNARKVNAHATLLRRARECQRIRRRLPAVVAVDFYGQGDVVGVTDALNGVARDRGGR